MFFGRAEPNGQLSGVLLKVVEDTPTVYNLLVCTLCSCYPISILGMAPSWYKVRSTLKEGAVMMNHPKTPPIILPEVCVRCLWTQHSIQHCYTSHAAQHVLRSLY